MGRVGVRSGVILTFGGSHFAQLRSRRLDVRSVRFAGQRSRHFRVTSPISRANAKGDGWTGSRDDEIAGAGEGNSLRRREGGWSGWSVRGRR